MTEPNGCSRRFWVGCSDSTYQTGVVGDFRKVVVAVLTRRVW